VLGDFVKAGTNIRGTAQRRGQPDGAGAAAGTGARYTQCVIELITDLARAEDRYAVDVLNDILRHAAAEAASANVPAAATKTEPAPR
jgi:hypothetical protein